jgi:hypothetical protein
LSSSINLFFMLVTVEKYMNVERKVMTKS